MLRFNFLFSLLSLFILGLTGCREAIDLPLDSSEPVFVVESTITDERRPLIVRLSKSGDFYENEYTPVTDAQVSITDGVQTISLTYFPEGKYYQSDTVQLASQKLYTLDIVSEGKRYQATSFMDSVPNFTDVVVDYKSENEGNYKAGHYYPTVYLKDPGNYPNFYRLKVYKNDTMFRSVSSILITEDKFFEGQLAYLPLYFEYDKGDTMRLEVLSLSRANYKYLYEYIRAVRAGASPFSSVPANPSTNIVCLDDPKEVVMGFFGASAMHYREIIIDK